MNFGRNCFGQTFSSPKELEAATRRLIRKMGDTLTGWKYWRILSISLKEPVNRAFQSQLIYGRDITASWKHKPTANPRTYSWIIPLLVFFVCFEQSNSAEIHSEISAGGFGGRGVLSVIRYKYPFSPNYSIYGCVYFWIFDPCYLDHWVQIRLFREYLQIRVRIFAPDRFIKLVPINQLEFSVWTRATAGKHSSDPMNVSPEQVNLVRELSWIHIHICGIYGILVTLGTKSQICTSAPLPSLGMRADVVESCLVKWMEIF